MRAKPKRPGPRPVRTPASCRPRRRVPPRAHVGPDRRPFRRSKPGRRSGGIEHVARDDLKIGAGAEQPRAAEWGRPLSAGARASMEGEERHEGATVSCIFSRSPSTRAAVAWIAGRRSGELRRAVKERPRVEGWRDAPRAPVDEYVALTRSSPRRLVARGGLQEALHGGAGGGPRRRALGAVGARHGSHQGGEVGGFARADRLGVPAGVGAPRRRPGGRVPNSPGPGRAAPATVARSKPVRPCSARSADPRRHPAARHRPVVR